MNTRPPWTTYFDIILNHQLTQELQLVGEGKFNYISSNKNIIRNHKRTSDLKKVSIFFPLRQFHFVEKRPHIIIVINDYIQIYNLSWKSIPYPCKDQLHSTAAHQRTSLKDTPKSSLQRMPIPIKVPTFSYLPKEIL